MREPSNLPPQAATPPANPATPPVLAPPLPSPPMLRLGLDLSTRDAACALANAQGETQVALRVELAPQSDAPACWLALMELARETLRRADALPTQIAGCALAFPGPMAGGVVQRDFDLPGWEGFDVPRALSEHLHISSARAETRLLCAARGEATTGALRPDESFDGRDWMFVALSARLEAIVCANGQIVRGSDGVAGALGAIIIERDGAVSSGGRRGGLDAYASLDGIATRAASYGLPGKTLREVAELAVSNFGAQTLYEDTITRLAQGLSAVVCVMNPRRIVLAGAQARELGEVLLEPLTSRLRDFCPPALARNLQIRAAELGADAPLLGALAIAGDDLT